MPGDPSVSDAVAAMLAEMDLDATGEALASIARALAGKLDDASFTRSGAVAVAVPSIAKELRATLAELTGALSNDDELLARILGRSS